MKPATNRTFRKPFKKMAYGNSFINQSDLGPELTESNCSAELYKELMHEDKAKPEDDKPLNQSDQPQP